jgi:hypothetical protein
VVGAFGICLPDPVSQGDRVCGDGCDCGNDDLKAEIEIVNPSCPFTPSPPVWLTAAGQSNSVCLNWVPNPVDVFKVQYFKVYHRYDGSDGWQLVDRVPLMGGTMQYVDGSHGGLANGRTYDYYVTSACIAVCSFTCTAFFPIPIEHESLPSPMASAIPFNRASPPANFQGAFSTIGGNHVHLTWGAPSDNGGYDIAGYDVYRLSSSGILDLIGFTDPSVTVYDDFSVATDSSYHYQVSAFTVGPGDMSNEVIITVPGAPGPIADVSVYPDYVWEALHVRYYYPTDNGGSKILGFEVNKKDFMGRWQLVERITLGAIAPLPPIDYLDTAVQFGCTYTYRVTSWNAIGYAPWSEPVSNYLEKRSPSAPQRNIGTLDGLSVTLNWTRPSTDGGAPILGWRIYRCAPPASWVLMDDLSYDEVPVSLDGTLSYRDPPADGMTLLLPDTTYRYSVTAYNEIGEGVGCPTNDLKTPADVIAPVVEAGPDQTVSAGTEVTLDGSASTDNFGTANIANYTWTLDDNGLMSLYGVEAQHRFNTPGIYEVTLTAKDYGDNVATDMLTVTVTDVLPPVTTADLSGSMGGEQWYTSAVDVTLTPTDEYAEVEWSKYRLDGGSWITYSTAVTVSEDGEHTVEYYSRDTAGNEETASVVTFKIDSTKPTLEVSDQTKTKYTKNQVIIRWTGGDELSGVDHYEYSLDGDAFENLGNATKVTLSSLSDGRHDVVIRAVDKAGNVAEETVVFDVNTNILSTGGPMGSLPLVAIVAVVVAAITVGSLLVMKYKKRRTPKPPASGE